MSLSDKRINVPTLNQENAYYYPEESVKEIIEKVKNIIMIESIKEDLTIGQINERINELAGDELI